MDFVRLSLLFSFLSYVSAGYVFGELHAESATCQDNRTGDFFHFGGDCILIDASRNLFRIIECCPIQRTTTINDYNTSDCSNAPISSITVGEDECVPFQYGGVTLFNDCNRPIPQIDKIPNATSRVSLWGDSLCSIGPLQMTDFYSSEASHCIGAPDGSFNFRIFCEDVRTVRIEPFNDSECSDPLAPYTVPSGTCFQSSLLLECNPNASTTTETSPSTAESSALLSESSSGDVESSEGSLLVISYLSTLILMCF